MLVWSDTDTDDVHILISYSPPSRPTSSSSLLPPPRYSLVPQGINDLVTPFFFVFLMEATGADEETVASGLVMQQISSSQIEQVCIMY